MRNPYEAILLQNKVRDRRTGEVFNPMDFDPVSARSGTRKVSASRMFNDAGEINAGSKLEVLQKIKALLDGTATGEFDITRTADTYDPVSTEEQDAILREALANPQGEGFAQTGQALLNPVKEIIDYEGVARRCLNVRTVKSGETFRLDKDIFTVAHVIAEDGQTPQSVVEGRYIYPAEFEVSTYPSIELKDIYRAQYDMLVKIQDRSKQAIEYKEDKAMTTMLLAASTQMNSISYFASLNLAAFEAMRYQIDRHRLLCDKFLIHRRELSDMITVLTTEVDPVTQRELIMAGYIGSILNATIMTTAGVNTYEILEPGQVLALAAPDYLGVFATRVELISEPTNEFHEGRPRRGWYWWEMISQVVPNAAGVAQGSKTT